MRFGLLNVGVDVDGGRVVQQKMVGGVAGLLQERGGRTRESDGRRDGRREHQDGDRKESGANHKGVKMPRV